MAEHQLIVWQRPYVVNVERLDDRKWVAVGTYAGKTIRIVERTSGAALKKWRMAALCLKADDK